MPQDDPTNRAGEHPHEPAVPVVTPHRKQPVVATAQRSRIPRRWLPLAAIIVIAVVALAIALPLTLGGSSSSVTATPPGPSEGVVTGSYLTTTVQDQRLVFASLVETGTALSGSLTVTTSGPAHKHLVTRLYTVSGAVSGPTLNLTLTPTNRTAASITFTATYASGTITAASASGGTLRLVRGTLATYRLLVRQDRQTLLG